MPPPRQPAPLFRETLFPKRPATSLGIDSAPERPVEERYVRAVGILLLLIVLSPSALHAADFKDVPKDHWAAEYVRMLAGDGIVKGYPDGTFRGDQPVTRYELAAVLASFVQFMQQSEQPVVAGKKELTLTPPAARFANPMTFLKIGGFLRKDSKLLKGGNVPATYSDLSQSLTSVATRLIEMRVPPVDGVD